MAIAWRVPWLSLLRRYGAALGLIGLCLGLMAFSLVRLSEVSRDMRIQATENMLWVISQTEIEALKLNAAIAQALLGTADVTVLNLRYDMLISRLSLLLDGPQRRYLDEIGYDDALSHHKAIILAADPLESPLFAGDAASAAQLQQAVAGLSDTLSPLTRQIMISDWEQLATRLDLHRLAIGQVVGSLIGVIVGLIFLGQRLVANRQQLLRAEHEKLRAARLDIELQHEKKMSARYRDFGAVVSHQFRTPLAIIDSTMQRLVRKGDSVSASEVASRSAIVSQVVGRLMRLVDAGLLIGRLDSGQVDMRLQSCEMTALVGNACEAHRNLHPLRQIVLTHKMDDLRARCDPALTVHILDNLLGNAVKYSDETAVLECRLFAVDQGIACAVIDAGCGMDDDDLTKLFEKFHRGVAGSTMDGSGLGLHIARSLARMQNGEITAQRRQDRQGAVFTLWLPAAVVPTGTLAAAVPQADATSPQTEQVS